MIDRPERQKSVRYIFFYFFFNRRRKHTVIAVIICVRHRRRTIGKSRTYTYMYFRILSAPLNDIILVNIILYCKNFHCPFCVWFESLLCISHEIAGVINSNYLCKVVLNFLVPNDISDIYESIILMRKKLKKIKF